MADLTQIRNIRKLKDDKILVEIIKELEKNSYEGLGEYVLCGFGSREYDFLNNKLSYGVNEDGRMLVKVWRLDELYKLKNSCRN